MFGAPAFVQLACRGPLGVCWDKRSFGLALDMPVLCSIIRFPADLFLDYFRILLRRLLTTLSKQKELYVDNMTEKTCLQAHVWFTAEDEIETYGDGVPPQENSAWPPLTDGWSSPENPQKHHETVVSTNMMDHAKNLDSRKIPR